MDWQVSSQFGFKACRKRDVPTIVMFGATSMLGKYVVETFQSDENVCLVSFSRSKCEVCDISIKGDVRDIRLIQRVLGFYEPNSIVTSVKPPLTGVPYKTYIEINLFAMVQLIDAAKMYGVRNFIYVSSIAAAGHYFDHHNVDEKAKKPYYTDFEAPYDVSKRFTEDYLLKQQSDRFNVISIRVSGIIGGTGDPYEYQRFPVLLAIDPPLPLIDSNYAGNVADALVVVYRRMRTISSGQECLFCGEFYYYTGESIPETTKTKIVAEQTGKPMIFVPRLALEMTIKFLHWARFEPTVSNYIDLFRISLVPQTFDQSKFHAAFPEFKPKVTVEDALRRIYSKKADSHDEL